MQDRGLCNVPGLKVREKGIQVSLSLSSRFPQLSTVLLDELDSQLALLLPFWLHSFAAARDRLMPEQEEFVAHGLAHRDVLQFLTSVRLLTFTHVVHVVNCASFEPYIALNASKLLIGVSLAFAVCEQHIFVSGLGGHILLPF